MTERPQKSFPDEVSSFSTSITKKIGATTYIVRVRFPEAERESAKDKIFRIIKSEASKGGVAS